MNYSKRTKLLFFPREFGCVWLCLCCVGASVTLLPMLSLHTASCVYNATHDSLRKIC
jgi:hypothetical protein